MADPTNQKAAFAFLSKHFQAGTTFTRADFLKETKWTEVSLSTYESKMIGNLYEQTASGDYRVTESFRRYADWKDFKKLVSQKKNTMLAKYVLEEKSNPIVFEFFLPLAHEVHMKDALDSLFYRDRVLARLKAKPISELRARRSGVSDDKKYIEELTDWLGDLFAGYSIGEVSGRYRAAPFCTKQEAVVLEGSGPKYLIDETTAVVRFIFPINNSKEIEPIRFFFRLVFVETILEVVDKEAEIWLLESGATNSLYIWRREEA